MRPPFMRQFLRILRSNLSQIPVRMQTPRRLSFASILVVTVEEGFV